MIAREDLRLEEKGRASDKSWLFDAGSLTSG